MRFDSKRRKFLIASAATGAGLVLSVYLYSRSHPPALPHSKDQSGLRPHAWLHIRPDGGIQVIVAKSEMGQGVWTGLSMLVAEELEVDWQTVAVEQAPSDPEYGYQSTGGSRSVRENWVSLREAGARARLMLVQAAAKTWSARIEDCRAERGTVVHVRDGRRLAYGELSVPASQLPVPSAVTLKDPKDFRLIGKSLPRLDTGDKVNGRARFGFDIPRPGVLTAIVVHCPVFGGRVGAVRADKALAVPGVRRVLTIQEGVAIVADGYWAAEQARALVEIDWEVDPKNRVSSESIRKGFRDLASQSGAEALRLGDVSAALAGAAKRIDAEYDAPFQAHATMEPMNCTASVTDSGCEVWAPTQSPSRAQDAASQHVNPRWRRAADKVLERIGVSVAKPVRVHTTLLGGGFGRRLEQDYVSEAVQLSRAMGGPVKVAWPRDEDMRHDFYRPASHHRLSAALDGKGRLMAWHHKIIAPSINDARQPGSLKNGVDAALVDGANNLPYDIPNRLVEYVLAPTPVPLGYWRSVGSSHNGFVTECFMDEVARAAGRDPLAYRLALLKESPRARAVLELAAEKAGWGRSPDSGRFLGIAFHYSFRSYVAQVADVSVSRQGGLRVHRVVCAVDCGLIVNPNTVAAQMEGGVMFGLSAVLKGAITLADGAVVQSNFHDFPILKMSEAPQVDTYFVRSQEDPTGAGEPGVPPIAPAVANAVFAATGKRVRELPIRQELFQKR